MGGGCSPGDEVQVRPPASSSHELHPSSFVPYNMSFLPTSFVLWIACTASLWLDTHSRNTDASLTFSTGMKPYIDTNLSLSQEYIKRAGEDHFQYLHLNYSQTPLWVSAFGPYPGCQLPALGLLAEAVQWGEVAVIYQCRTDLYWHKDSEEELRVLQVPPELYRALQQKQQILDLAPQQRMFLSKTIWKQLKDAALLQRNQDLIFAVPYS